VLLQINDGDIELVAQEIQQGGRGEEFLFHQDLAHLLFLLAGQFQGILQLFWSDYARLHQHIAYTFAGWRACCFIHAPFPPWLPI